MSATEAVKEQRALEGRRKELGVNHPATPRRPAKIHLNYTDLVDSIASFIHKDDDTPTWDGRWRFAKSLGQIIGGEWAEASLETLHINKAHLEGHSSQELRALEDIFQNCP